MQHTYDLSIVNPNFETLGYVVAIANIKDKHDRSAPSHFHWKILKCRMIIFSNSSVLACPDRHDVQKVHIIFNKIGDSYDKLNSSFLKFSLIQEGLVKKTTCEVYQMCFQYTMTAKIAPLWNTLGSDYLINNREFLTANGPQDGVKYHISCDDNTTVVELKPVKIRLLQADRDFLPGEWIRVLPSLRKATVAECHDALPATGSFLSYKDMRRHWKNIHGYRLPEAEGRCRYCTVQFWRGAPLTYPAMCLTRDFPIVTPLPAPVERVLVSKFVGCLQAKMCRVLGAPLAMPGSFGGSGEVRRARARHGRLADTPAAGPCAPPPPPPPVRAAAAAAAPGGSTR